MIEEKAKSRTLPSDGIIHITQRVWKILAHLAKDQPLEWQCYAEVDRINGKEFLIKEIHFPKQKNTGGTTTTSEEDHGNFIVELVEKGVDISKLVGWVHSHNTMGVFWSGTDYAQMDRMGIVGEDTWGLDFAVHVVVNANGEAKGCISLYAPFTTYYDAVVKIYDEEGNKMLSEHELAMNLLEKNGLLDEYDNAIDGEIKRQEDIEAISTEIVKEYQAKLKANETLPVQTSIYNGGGGRNTWSGANNDAIDNYIDGIEVDMPQFGFGSKKKTQLSDSQREIDERIRSAIGQLRLLDEGILSKISWEEYNLHKDNVIRELREAYEMHMLTWEDLDEEIEYSYSFLTGAA